MKASHVGALCAMFVASAQAADYTISSIGLSGDYISSYATHINNQGQVLLNWYESNSGSSRTYGLDLSTGGSYTISEIYSGYRVYNYDPYTIEHAVAIRDFNNNGTYLGVDSVSRDATAYSDALGYTTEVVGNPFPGSTGSWSATPISSMSCRNDGFLDGCGYRSSDNRMTSYGLNDNNQVVGAFTPISGAAIGDTYASVISGLQPGSNDYGTAIYGGISRLSDPSLGIRYSAAYDINNQGTAVGVGDQRALLWSAGRTYSLGTLVSPNSPLLGQPNGNTFSTASSIAYAINDSGMVIGRSTAVAIDATTGQEYLSGAGGVGSLLNLPITSNGHAFVWKDGVMVDLGDVAVKAVNNNGLVVGTASGSNGEHGFLWKNGVGKLDLNSMIDSASGYRILSAEGINDQGMIVGRASHEICSAPGVCQTEDTAYLLNPGATGFTPINPILQTSTTGNIFGFASGANFIQLNSTTSRPGGFYDPAVAVGYVFDMESTDKAFTAVQVPYQYGDGIFELGIFDESTGTFVSTGTSLFAGSWYDFGVDGVKKFRITGVETSAYVDPNDPYGFVTGLTFTGADAQFNMTAMSSLIDATNPLNELQAVPASTVPVPAAAWLFGSGLVGLLGVARKRKLSA